MNYSHVSKTERSPFLEWSKAVQMVNGSDLGWSFQNPTKWPPLWLVLGWFGLGMVCPIAIALALTDYSKTELLKVWFWDGLRFSEFGFRAMTAYCHAGVLICRPVCGQFHKALMPKFLLRLVKKKSF